MTTDITSKRLVHVIDGAADVVVEQDHAYSTEQGPLGFDLYRPRHATAPCPVVVIVSGLPDPGVIAMLGKPLKDWASYMDWARMIAASGIACIAYANRVPADGLALLRHVRAHAAELGLDGARIGVWAASGHVANALGVIAQERPRCAALLYGYTLDVDGATDVAEAAKRFYFAVPPVALDDLPRAMPMLVVRAGLDATPGLNVALDRFVAAAQARDLAVTVVEHATGVHAFDMVDDSPRTHEVIEAVLAFLRRALA